jgi:NAD(P)-dependent dehydrogenase (short-subunit alcohol dehydrogenase family)
MTAYAQFDLHGRRAVVTGGATGIGYHIALALARSGAEVMIASRSVDQLRCATDAFNAERHSAPAHYRRVDLGDRSSIAALASYAVDTMGGVDIFVGNAGIDLLEPVGTMQDESIDTVVQVNLVSNLQLVRAFLPHMRANRWGRIILVSSSSTISASHCDGMTAYVAAKSGLDAAVKTIAAETGRDGITANTIVPGMFMTRIIDTTSARHEANDAELEAGRAFLETMASMTMVGRGAECHEIEGLAQLLASDAGSYITGANIVIDGGLSSMMRPNPVSATFAEQIGV